jgi:hypothetical protein
MHYKRMKKSGTTDPPAKKMPTTPRRMATACEHTDRPHCAKGLCASCYTIRWMKENPDANSGNRWNKNHPEKTRYHVRKSSLKKKYGLTMAQYEAMWEAQQGRCANVRCNFTGELLCYQRNGLHVDHDHKTGKVRGLLCSTCNKAMGMLGDDPGRLLGLIEYLSSFARDGVGSESGGIPDSPN